MSKNLLELAREVLAIASEGLSKRAALDWVGESEVHFLGALFEIVERGKTPAEELLDAYNTRWNHSVDPLFKEFSY